MLTEKQKKEIIETINFVFFPPRALKVVDEDEKYVYVLREDGETVRWKKSDVLPLEDLQ